MAKVESDKTAVLVCGLGILGQYCVSFLKEFGVIVHGIEAQQKSHWEIPELPDLLDTLLIGDCRQSKILEQAKIRECRTILLMTSDERVNIVTAFAARSLNPQVRLVIRSSQENLNEMLGQHLGNFVAFEPFQLPVSAFALTALGDETLGLFNIEGQFLEVFQLVITPKHPWCNCRQLYELNTFKRRILSHTKAEVSASNCFYKWEPDARVQAGDRIICIELNDRVVTSSSSSISSSRQIWPRILQNMRWQNLRQLVVRLWEEGSQTQRVIIVCSSILLILYLSGVILYKLQYPEIGLQDALNVSIVLILGGYDNLFGQLKLSFPIPIWLHLFSLILTIAGTIFIGILYAFLTERVLSARFQFRQQRPPVPKANHVVLIGLGRVGKQVATLLQQLKQPLVGVNNTDLEDDTLSQMPLIVGNIQNALNKVNLATAKSVMVLTDDEIANLEIALMARVINPACKLVISTVDPRFSKNVAQLLPHAHTLGVYTLAAEAFAAAAFGENILELLHLNNQTTLVTEYHVEAGDSLNGRLLAEVAYGYGVVPILHQRKATKSTEFMPKDDIPLQVGDRLIVLATIEGLQNVEQGKSGIRSWLVRVETALTKEAAFDGAMTIARISGCGIPMAHSLMNDLPGTLQFPLYKNQAQNLVHELTRVRVIAHLIQAPDFSR